MRAFYIFIAAAVCMGVSGFCKVSSFGEGRRLERVQTWHGAANDYVEGSVVYADDGTKSLSLDTDLAHDGDGPVAELTRYEVYNRLRKQMNKHIRDEGCDSRRGWIRSFER